MCAAIGLVINLLKKLNRTKNFHKCGWETYKNHSKKNKTSEIVNEIIIIFTIFLQYLSMICLLLNFYVTHCRIWNWIINIIIYYFTLFYCPNYRNKKPIARAWKTGFHFLFGYTNINWVVEWY